jgi:hypothetical protein
MYDLIQRMRVLSTPSGHSNTDDCRSFCTKSVEMYMALNQDTLAGSNKDIVLV